MSKNLIYITGNDSYGVEQEVKRWVQVFESKYSELNIERIRLENRSGIPLIRDNLTTTGLFAEKRLFLFSGGVERKSKTGGIEEMLETIKGAIPEDHFLLFHSLSSKEEGLIAWLSKNADTRTIDTVWTPTTWQDRFPEIGKLDIERVISAHRTREETLEPNSRNPLIGHEIATTLEMITLAGTHGPDIDELIHKEGGGKMFDLIDLILAEKVGESIRLLRRIGETTHPTEILSSLIGLLRSHLYIRFLVKNNFQGIALQNIIKIHPFVLKKSLGGRISHEKLHRLHHELVSANKAYKSGKGLQDVELGRILSIELALMGLKK